MCSPEEEQSQDGQPALQAGPGTGSALSWCPFQAKALGPLKKQRPCSPDTGHIGIQLWKVV